MVCSLLFEGDAFAKIKRDRMFRPIGLEPWHPLRVQNGPTEDGSRMVYRFEPEFINGVTIGKVETLDQDDVLHVPGFGFDGWRGLTPLRHSLRNAGALAIATQDYAGNFFANSARPDYALVSDQNISSEKAKEYQDGLDERHRTPAKAHRPMVLGGGLKIQTWSISASDMQLLSTRQFQIEEIARAYGVPPFMIGHTDKTTSWGSGVESMGKGFVRYSLRQHLHKFEVELNRKLFRTRARLAEFDTSDLERADTATLMASLRVGVGRAGEPRIMTPNEARAVLRLKKGDGAAEDALGINPGNSSPDSQTPAKDAKP
jgi:HK97 family phage portal protein